MALSFTQTDTANATCDSTERSSCVGAGTTAINIGKAASVGGTPGTGSAGSGTVPGSSTARDFHFFCTVGAGVTWGAGTWTVRLNVSSSNMNLTWTECYICKVASDCTGSTSIGSNTSVGISLGTTGVKTTTVSGSSVTPNAGDAVLVGFVWSNGAMTDQVASFTPDQNIDSPFTVVTPSLLWNPYAFLPHLVRRVREWFKPKPLFTPAPSFLSANDQRFRKTA